MAVPVVLLGNTEASPFLKQPIPMAVLAGSSVLQFNEFLRSVLKSSFSVLNLLYGNSWFYVCPNFGEKNKLMVSENMYSVSI